jgi:hypothetical protein
MQPQAFARLFPSIFHVTFASNLPSIQAHGLLSAAALADLYSFSEEERDACLLRRRLCTQDLHGIAIRDQLPAPESRMKTCLVNITIPEWLQLLNSKIFFFVSKQKAQRFLDTYDAFPNILFEVDTAALLQSHAAQASLTRIHPGSFLYNPRPRGRDSFIPLATFHYENKRNTPAELILDTPVPNLLAISSHTLFKPASAGIWHQTHEQSLPNPID